MRALPVTVVIPSKDMGPMLKLCLFVLEQALAYEGGHPEDKVVVLDNASEEPYPRDWSPGLSVEWIRYDVPRSFSACCNDGMKKFPNPAYLHLNNDVMLHEAAVSALVGELGDEKVGICGARLLFPNGTIQHAGIRFGPLERGPYHLCREQPAHCVPRTTTEFQAVTAACMLVRHATVEATGGFDEAFPFAWEDVDLCLRARQLGWKVVCNQAVDSLHFESMTPGRMEKDPPSREFFEERWAGKWSIDG